MKTELFSGCTVLYCFVNKRKGCIVKLLSIVIFLLLTISVWADSYIPDTYNEVAQQGEDFVRHLQIVDSNKNPIDITGRSYKAQFRPMPGSSVIFANFSTVITSATNGTFDIILHKEQTHTLGPKIGFWDLLEQMPDGLVGYRFKGQFSISPTTTR